MNPKEYIITKIDQLVKLFPQTRVRYECDDFSGTHTVEITPQSEYNKEAMMKWQSEVFEDFFDLYPAEAVCFVSEDALVSVKEADVVKTGALYNINTDYTVSNFNVTPVTIISPQLQPSFIWSQDFSSYGFSSYKFSDNPYSSPITTSQNYPLAA